MVTGKALAAVDLGAGSGRVMLGRVSPDRLQITELHRFPNQPLTTSEGLFWDAPVLLCETLAGLTAAVRMEPDLAGVAIDSWGADYGLVDSRGQLRGNPHSYRDDRTGPAVARIHATMSPGELYAVNGLQYMPFNTVYQLAADAFEERLDAVALLTPDLFGFQLTGHRHAETTIASTTGLLDARSGTWSAELLAAANLPASLLPPLVPPGVEIGPLSANVRAQIGAGTGLRLYTVGGHDTASAVAGIPAGDEQLAFLSCGTWSLLGIELAEPVLTEESRRAGFSNERGIDGTTTYLSNVMGLWLLSESLATWARQGHRPELDRLLAEAAEFPAGGPCIDPDRPEFLPPGDMPARIAVACSETGQPVPGTPARMARCILDSLAATFARRLSDAERITGRRVDVLHMVGGGIRNRLLCQLTANAIDRPVVVGPVEATTIGSLVVQARAAGALSGSLPELRAFVARFVRTETYLPTH